MKKKKIQRVDMPEQKPEIRKKNFFEVPTGYTDKMAQDEASRCIQCKKPSCINGCPVEINIPKFIEFISKGNFYKAIDSLWEQNTLPAICGRVCPQEIQCEGKCIIGKRDKPVAIGNLERFVADWAIKNNKFSFKKKITSLAKKKVAIVGSGPSGLTVASDLVKKGYSVTILEAFHKPGGVLVYGIPEFRLPKSIVAHEINILKKMGVNINVNNVVGRSISLDELLTEEGYDAVYLGVGAGLPRFMNIPGENLIGVLSANEYLTRANLMKAYSFPEVDTPMPIGSNVVVLGGGNVAMDSARTAMRLGAKKVSIVYRRSREEMPARLAEVHHAEEEGIQFILLTNPIKFFGDENSRLVGMECLKMKLGKPDKSGRRKPIPLQGSEFKIEIDLAIISVGAGPNPLLINSVDDLNLNKWGYVVADEETGKTSKKAVWAGGDIVTGAATVILAMGAGRKAANSIHSYLTTGW